MSSIGGLLGGSLLADPLDNILGTGTKRKASATEATDVAPSGFRMTNVPLVPPNNSWSGMDFKTPAGGGMKSTILEQFPQLQALFGGMSTGGGGGVMPPATPPPPPTPPAGAPQQSNSGSIWDFLNKLKGGTPYGAGPMQSLFDALGSSIPR